MNVQAKVASIVESEKAKLVAAMQKVEAYDKWATAKTAIYEKHIETIKSILRSEGFEFNELGFIGNHSDSIQKLDLTGAYFQIDMTLRMIGRRKTFTHMGYNASGNDKQRKHHELSQKIVAQLNEACAPDMTFALNPFSLIAGQYKETEQSDRVLFSMYVFNVCKLNER